MEDKKKTELIPDSRFQSIGKEAFMVAIYWIVMFVGIMLSAAILGAGDPTQYAYFCGLPLWFAVCIGIMIVGILVGIFMCLKVFKDISLDAADPEFDYEKGAKK